MRLFSIVLLCIYWTWTGWAWGQSMDQGKESLQIGFGLTGTSYIGDFSDEEVFVPRIYPGGNISLQIRSTRLLSFQVNGGFGKFADQYDLSSPDLPDGVTASSFVETRFIYGDLRLHLRLMPRSRIQPYLSVGAGILHFSPRNEEGKKLENRTNTRLEGENYNSLIPELPAVAGVRMKLNRTLDISLDYTFKYTPTDYLDNIGLIGNREGFDALHAIQLTLYVALSPAEPPAEAMDNTIPIAPETPMATLPNEENPSAATREKDVISNSVPQEEPTPEAESPPLVEVSDETAIYPEVQDEMPRDSQLQERLQAIEDAIDQEKFVFYQVKKGETLSSLVERTGIPADILRELNYLSGDKLRTGSWLRLPDIGLNLD